MSSAVAALNRIDSGLKNRTGASAVAPLSAYWPTARHARSAR